MASDDTTFIDNNEGLGLQPGMTYKYKIEAFFLDSLKDTSTTLIAVTLDTAGHSFNWVVDTIGLPGNILVDVWGYDENNVWAIGVVDLPEGRSGVIKWNGAKWEIYPGFGAEKKGIYGVDQDNIFVVGSSGSFGVAGIWDGISWEVTDFLFHYPQGDTIWGLRAVWATSQYNIWAVGHQGTIVHWNGEEWHKMKGINNQLSFWDIHGFDEENIYAVGNTSSTLFIYKFNGIEWQLFYTDNRGGSITSSIWGPHKNLIYVTDAKEYRINYGNVFEFFIRGQESVINRIRGSSANNIYTVGDFGEVFHYNGANWQKQTELYTHPDSRLLQGIWANDEVVFIVGLTGDSGAIIIRGEKINQ